MYKLIKLNLSDSIARISLNRPEKLNALSQELQLELAQCLKECDEDPTVEL